MSPIRRLPLLALGLAALTAPAAAQGATFTPIRAGGFTLERHGLDAAAYGRVRAVARSHPGVSVRHVVEDANRLTRPLAGSPAVSGVANLEGGFRWNAGDDGVSYWTPQGITGSADATDGGSVGGHRILLASWYSDTKGVRVSFVRADSLRGARYRHVLLVTPRANGSFGLVRIHAGGIAWFRHFLYVADTFRGIRVFDTRRLMYVPERRRAASLDYKYVLPQVGHYRSTGRALRYSFVSLDRSGSRPSLLAGEYRDGVTGGRLVRWPLSAKTGLLSARRAFAAVTGPRSNMQGALTLGGRYYTSSSAGSRHGTLAVGRPRRAARTRTWAVGPEDLTYSRFTNRLYSLTEHRGNRVVFGVGL